jgi:glycosyltransferase involved in cell wall biosynthesis
MNVQEMADKLVALLKNRNTLEEFGKNAKSSSQQYLAENVMDKWYKLFD